jgi:dipeptidyl aminopeptidase/acylaminoacyl peptidase
MRISAAPLFLSPAAACAALLALSTAPPSLAAPPPLLPRQQLFSEGGKGSPRLSPDGTRLSWRGPSRQGIPNIWVVTLGKNDSTQVTDDRRAGINAYAWSEDGRRILYVQDRDGDENFHLYALELASGKTVDLTPFPGVRVEGMFTHPLHPAEVLVGLNRRDPKVFDVHRVNLASGEVVLDTENPGDVIAWATDADFVVRGAVALDPDDSATLIRVRDAAGAPWRQLFRWSFEEAGFDRMQRIVGFTTGGDGIIVQMPVGANTTRLVEVDARTGKERAVLAHDPRCDLWNELNESGTSYDVAVLLHPRTCAVQAVGLEYLKPEWKVLDPAIRADFDRLARTGSGVFEVVSRDQADRRWIVHLESDVSPGSYVIYDRGRQKVEPLFEERPDLVGVAFAAMKGMTFRARDGLEIPCYLTLPVGVEAKRLPIVLMPHGGPWFRDSWGYDPSVQWLANRGYAVLQVNFRGSTGFGKQFLNAGTGQLGTGHMQHDLTDAVAWAVEQGIADPKRVGIMGGSYGGYAVLAGLAFTPDLYACGVDMVGPSNLKSLIESFPPYWAPRRRRWLLRIGDVVANDSLNRSISPLFHVDRIRSPLLIGHGANDPRVKLAESEEIVKAMRAKARSVTFVVYPDEGHGFGRSENTTDFSGRVEEFLARCLGGRVEPWREVPGSSAQVR